MERLTKYCLGTAMIGAVMIGASLGSLTHMRNYQPENLKRLYEIEAGLNEQVNLTLGGLESKSLSKEKGKLISDPNLEEIRNDYEERENVLSWFGYGGLLLMILSVSKILYGSYKKKKILNSRYNQI